MPLYAYSRPSLQGRTLPVLIGLAIGDAMGATQEFERPENPVPYPALMTGPQVDFLWHEANDDEDVEGEE